MDLSGKSDQSPRVWCFISLKVFLLLVLPDLDAESRVGFPVQSLMEERKCLPDGADGLFLLVICSLSM